MDEPPPRAPREPLAQPLPRRMPGAGEKLPPFVRGGVPVTSAGLVGDGTGADIAPEEEESEEVSMAKVEAAMSRVPTGPQQTVWRQYDDYREEVRGGHASAGGSMLERAGHDHRGLFAAVAALFALLLTFLDWYTWNVGSSIRHFTIYSEQYSGWYVAIPLVLGLAVLVGLLNFALRPGDPGALAVFITLRVLAVGAVGLIACAMWFRVPKGAPTGYLAPTVALKWPMLVALGMSLVMVASSLATGLRKGQD